MSETKTCEWCGAKDLVLENNRYPRHRHPASKDPKSGPCGASYKVAFRPEVPPMTAEERRLSRELFG